ncbi:hypothetical protein HOLleu_22850 [Holothuria leucospilota]|uniref:Uncharacterized protein n=1 Tax=Holothuria leucospilota TaxID=206669 RepID=A0A9Q1BUA6_HOLLE|nr:hypothetical protein HOLleu_22850 [Holothuria leucospilota]
MYAKASHPVLHACHLKLITCPSVPFELSIFSLRAKVCHLDLHYFSCAPKHAIWT